MLCCQWCKEATASQSDLRYFIVYQSDEFALSEVVLDGDGEGIALSSGDLGRYLP